MTFDGFLLIFLMIFDLMATFTKSHAPHSNNKILPISSHCNTSNSLHSQRSVQFILHLIEIYDNFGCYSTAWLKGKWTVQPTHFSVCLNIKPSIKYANKVTLDMFGIVRFRESKLTFLAIFLMLRLRGTHTAAQCQCCMVVYDR